MWILMGLLIIGLGGFGITNLGGTVRSVGSVGTAQIDVQTYARALRNEINALSAERGSAVSLAEAQAAGLDRPAHSEFRWATKRCATRSCRSGRSRARMAALTARHIASRWSRRG
jgi:hypothetical protein